MQIQLKAAIASVLLAVGVAIPVYAAEPGELPVLPEPASIATEYPVEVNYSSVNGVPQIEKLYELRESDNPSAIPMDSFTWDGKKYVFSELVREETPVDSKEHEESVTVNSTTNNMEEILKSLDKTTDITTEDGYQGTLALDYESVHVDTNGYRTNSYTVTANRTYPNLSDADLSLIPKTATENGRTLNLEDVSWDSATSDYMDGYSIPIRYTAYAKYTGTGYSKKATGYSVTANYKGTVSKTADDTIVYRAVFTQSNPFLSLKTNTGNALLVVLWGFIIAALVALVIIGGNKLVVYLKQQYQHYQNKKRGYEE